LLGRSVFSIVGLTETSARKSKDRARGHPQLRVQVDFLDGTGWPAQGRGALRPADCAGAT